MILNFFFICSLYYLNFFYSNIYEEKLYKKNSKTIFIWEKISMLDSFHTKINLLS